MMLEFVWAHPFISFIYICGIIGFVVWKLIIPPYLLRAKLPPGPMPLPFAGNVMMFKGTKDPIGIIVGKMIKKYGDPITIWMGSVPTIWCSKTDSIRDLLIDNPHDFQGRPITLIGQLYLNGTPDIMFGQYNDPWQYHKKLGTKAVRAVVDSTKVAFLINEAVEDIIEFIMKENGPVLMNDYTSMIVLNVIYLVCFGKRLSYDDPVYKMKLEQRGEQLKYMKVAMLMEAVPFATYLAPIIRRVVPAINGMQKLMNTNMDFAIERLQEHKNYFNPENEPKDILDAFLYEQHQQSLITGEATQKLSDNYLAMIIADICQAGVETTSATLEWFFLEMIMEPEIQEKCHQRIIETIGTRPPALTDRKSLSFVEACVLETLRMHPVAPLGVPTTPSIPVAKYKNYEIPQETLIITNLMALHYDEQYWKNPDKFDPTRFLDEDNVVMKPPYWLPFGCGKRVCMGEALAKNDLFLVVTELLQKLRFHPAVGETYSRELYENDFNAFPKHRSKVNVKRRVLKD